MNGGCRAVDQKESVQPNPAKTLQSSNRNPGLGHKKENSCRGIPSQELAKAGCLTLSYASKEKQNEILQTMLLDEKFPMFDAPATSRDTHTPNNGIRRSL